MANFVATLHFGDCTLVTISLLHWQLLSHLFYLSLVVARVAYLTELLIPKLLRSSTNTLFLFYHSVLTYYTLTGIKKYLQATFHKCNHLRLILLARIEVLCYSQCSLQFFLNYEDRKQGSKPSAQVWSRWEFGLYVEIY